MQSRPHNLFLNFPFWKKLSKAYILHQALCFLLPETDKKFMSLVLRIL